MDGSFVEDLGRAHGLVAERRDLSRGLAADGAELPRYVGRLRELRCAIEPATTPTATRNGLRPRPGALRER